MMSLEEVKRQLLLEGITLPKTARVLVSWQDDRLADMLQEFIPAVQVDYLMNMELQRGILKNKQRLSWQIIRRMQIIKEQH